MIYGSTLLYYTIIQSLYNNFELEFFLFAFKYFILLKNAQKDEIKCFLIYLFFSNQLSLLKPNYFRIFELKWHLMQPHFLLKVSFPKTDSQVLIMSLWTTKNYADHSSYRINFVLTKYFPYAHCHKQTKTWIFFIQIHPINHEWAISIETYEWVTNHSPFVFKRIRTAAKTKFRRTAGQLFYFSQVLFVTKKYLSRSWKRTKLFLQ